MRHASVWLLGPVLALSALITACGDDGGDDGGNGPGGGSIPGDTKLSEIDTDEKARAVCERASSKVKKEDFRVFREGSCALAGVFAELAGQDCATTKAQCLADSPDTTDAESCTVDSLPHCDVTVDAYIACMAAQMKAGAALFKNVSCDSDLSSLPLEGAQPPSECTSVIAACPDLEGPTGI